MRRSFIRWLQERQRAALHSDTTIKSLRDRANSVTDKARSQRIQELRIAQVSPSSPVVDRIKGHTR